MNRHFPCGKCYRKYAMTLYNIYEFTLESHRKELIKKRYKLVVEDRYNGDIRYLTRGKINEIFFYHTQDNEAKGMKESEKTKVKGQ